MKSKKKIFVVDDDKVALELLKYQLKELENVKIEVFTSAESCLNQMHEKPDLILLDFYLDAYNPNNMTGHDALAKFQDQHTEANILFISGEHNEELLELYNKYRHVDYLIKNKYTTHYFLQKVRRQLAA